MIRNIIIILYMTLIYFSAYSADNNIRIESYVNKLTTQASSMLNDPKLSEQDKISKSSQLIAGNLDFDWMARYTLGRHRRELSENQITDFIKVYSNYVTKIYSERVKNYKGESANIQKVQQLSEGEFIVKTQIAKTDEQQAINVDYLVRNVSKNKEPNFKIADVITEGVSMISSQQSEFNSIIINKSFETLIADLKKKL